MKVLDLHCGLGHAFEGWFGSETDYRDQRARGLVACPACGDTDVTKRPSAPRLNFGAVDPVSTTKRPDKTQRSLAPPGSAQIAIGDTPVTLQQVQAMVVRMARVLAAGAEDVGADFADEARRIHHGAAAERAIRGRATRADADALLDEGIAVLPLVLPEGFDGPVH